jgi:hypothetical protein
MPAAQRTYQAFIFLRVTNASAVLPSKNGVLAEGGDTSRKNQSKIQIKEARNEYSFSCNRKILRQLVEQDKSMLSLVKASCF